MKKLLLASLALVALPAFAEEKAAEPGGPKGYIGVKYYPAGQLRYKENIFGWNSGVYTSPDESGPIKEKWSGFGLVFGFESLPVRSLLPIDNLYSRLEAEFAFLNFKDSGTNEHGVPYKNENDVKMALFNAYADFTRNPKIVPYIGVGIGFAQIDITSTDESDEFSIIGNDVTYALSIGAGILFKVNQQWAIDLGVKHIKLGDTEYRCGGTDGNGLTYKVSDTSFTSASVGAMVSF